MKSWFFKMMNTIDKPLARVIEKIREVLQITKIRNERKDWCCLN